VVVIGVSLDWVAVVVLKEVLQQQGKQRQGRRVVRSEGSTQIRMWTGLGSVQRWCWLVLPDRWFCRGTIAERPVQ